MNSAAATPHAGCDDNMGARAAREAAEALRATTLLAFFALLSGRGSAAMLVGALMRLTEATAAAERLHNRQLSAAVIRAAYRKMDYDAGYEAGYEAAARRARLRAV
jgi:hypothetical protein